MIEIECLLEGRRLRAFGCYVEAGFFRLAISLKKVSQRSLIFYETGAKPDLAY